MVNFIEEKKENDDKIYIFKPIGFDKNFFILLIACFVFFISGISPWIVIFINNEENNFFTYILIFIGLGFWSIVCFWIFSILIKKFFDTGFIKTTLKFKNQELIIKKKFLFIKFKKKFEYKKISTFVLTEVLSNQICNVIYLSTKNNKLILIKAISDYGGKRNIHYFENLIDRLNDNLDV